MRKFLRNVWLGVFLAGSVQQAGAFALHGQWEGWMTPNEGYQLPFDVGGPMNLGEEYRWNLPLITYGFDESFLNYFGPKGVAEVEKALKVLMDLPLCSQMSEQLKEFPLDTRRFNHRARALYLFDLKSFVLGAMLEELGVAPAERYVWTLRSRVLINNIPVSIVMKRNFEPVYPYAPSAYVNGTLYTYLILQTWATPVAYEAVEFEVDPSLPSVSSVSAACMWGGNGNRSFGATGIFVNNEPGLFYTGLTRDDVGAIRYLYRPQNVNVEVLATNAVLAPVGSMPGNYILETGTGSPWSVPGATNIGGTNVPPVVQALRPGVDRLSFVRVNFDSIVGGWNVVTNRYVDSYITNSTRRTQQLERALATPDILFCAGDLGIDFNGLPYYYWRTIAWVNNDAINGVWALGGPGQISPPITMTFSKIGQHLVNIGDGGEVDAFPGFWWGSYDGTTNEPVVYPAGARIRDLERLVMSGALDKGPNPWQVPYTQTTGP
jgi:hypothetical protein